MWAGRGSGAGCSLRNTNRALRAVKLSNRVLLSIWHTLMEHLLGAGMVAGTEGIDEGAPCPERACVSKETHH